MFVAMMHAAVAAASPPGVLPLPECFVFLLQFSSPGRVHPFVRSATVLLRLLKGGGVACCIMLRPPCRCGHRSSLSSSSSAGRRRGGERELSPTQAVQVLRQQFENETLGELTGAPVQVGGLSYCCRMPSCFPALAGRGWHWCCELQPRILTTRRSASSSRCRKVRRFPNGHASVQALILCLRPCILFERSFDSVPCAIKVTRRLCSV